MDYELDGYKSSQGWWATIGMEGFGAVLELVYSVVYCTCVSEALFAHVKHLHRRCYSCNRSRSAILKDLCKAPILFLVPVVVLLKLGIPEPLCVGVRHSNVDLQTISQFFE